MKALIFLSLFIALNANFFALFQQQQNQTCDDTFYGNNKDKCDGVKRRCKMFYVCRNGECTYGQIGAQCEVKEHCFGHAEENLRCVKGVCTKPKYASSPCVEDLGCWSGVCKDGLCVGKAPGTGCDPYKPAECSRGFYCSLRSRKCERQIPSLSLCAGEWVYDPNFTQGANYNVLCADGNVCMGPNGTESCRPWRDGKPGTPCNFRRDGNEGCQFGTRCSQAQGICLPVTDLTETPCPGSPRNCSTQRMESCVCDEKIPNIATCRMVNDMYDCDHIEYMNKYKDCMIENKCPYEKNFFFSWLTDTIDGKSCLGKNCGYIAKELMCCAFPQFRRRNWSPVSSGALQCPQDAENNAGRVIGVLFALFVLCVLAGCGITGVAFAIYFIIKRQNQSKYVGLE